MDEDDGLIWEDPGPPEGRGRVVWYFPELKENPGKWARMPGLPSGLGALKERHGPDGFEFVTRNRDGRRVLYARWCPAEGDGPGLDDAEAARVAEDTPASSVGVPEETQ